MDAKTGSILDQRDAAITPEVDSVSPYRVYRIDQQNISELAVSSLHPSFHHRSNRLANAFLIICILMMAASIGPYRHHLTILQRDGRIQRTNLIFRASAILLPLILLH